MRVVEPRTFHHDRPPRRKRRWGRTGLLVLAALAVLAGVVFGFSRPTGEQAAEQSPTPQLETAEPQPTPTVQPAPVVDDGIDTLRVFDDNEFKLFYDQLLQPNLLRVENPPTISGNDVADARIRSIAEQRGYKLRSSPSVSLVSTDGYLVQASVVDPWQRLKTAAAAEGLSMSIVSAYRSVDTQRSLFLSRLGAAGASIAAVEQGTADAIVNEVLITSSIPGYSKHHTGYTIDLLCAGYGFEDFKNSPCNTWITADNYKVAKEHGFIPSYPQGADFQGPDPEAWEYVWVGTDLLYE